MSELASSWCPCGEPAPAGVPPAGHEPVACGACGTPLVQPGPIPRVVVEKALGAGLLAAVAGAAAWWLLARETGTGAHAALALSGGLVGLAVRFGGGVRGGPIQIVAVIAFLSCLALGEVLNYRDPGALLPRLRALHEAEGAPNAESLAMTELDSVDIEHYLHIELRFGLFAGVAVGLALALLLTRAPPAVATFGVVPGADEDEEEGDADERGDDPDAETDDGIDDSGAGGTGDAELEPAPRDEDV